MRNRTNGARWRAAATAGLLLVTGGGLGVLADRFWLSPPEVQATPLTAETMATRLGLSSAHEEHLRALLDSLHAEILAVVEEDPSALRATVRSAQHRIEAALPPDRQVEFRAWIREHHDHMIGRMHDGTMDHGEMHGGGSGSAPDAGPDPRR